MTKKAASIRLPEQQTNYILENYKNINFGIVSIVDALQIIRKYSLSEIKGVFTPGEWSFFADSLNGTITDGIFRCSKEALIYHCQDAEQLDGTASKWDVDLAQLTAKIEKLTGAQVEALYFRIEQFWEGENRDLGAFSNY
jgi:hypothetical protein